MPYSNYKFKLTCRKFKKNGFVAAAISKFRYDTPDSDLEGVVTEKHAFKKKKKRKTASKKNKKLQSPKVESSKFKEKGKWFA